MKSTINATREILLIFAKIITNNNINNVNFNQINYCLYYYL